MKLQRKRILLVSILLFSLLLPIGGCKTKGVVTNPNGQPVEQKLTADDILRGAKVFGKTLSAALEQGIPLEATLAANGTIDASLHKNLSQWLTDGKKATDEFNAKIAKYDHFDATSRADIEKFIDDALAFITRMNSEGVLRIKNPQSQLIASGILAGASVAVHLYRATFDEFVKR